MRNLLIILLISIMALTLSCGGGGSSSAGNTTVSIAVSKGSSSTSLVVQSLTFTISGSGMDTISKTVNVSGETTHTEHFDIPNGSNRHFLVVALGSGSSPLFQGDAFADLDGTPKQVSISMGFNVSGEWTFTITDQKGPVTRFVTFTQTGNSLTLTSISSDGEKPGAGNGNITGNNIQLTDAGTDCGNALSVSMQGIVSADGSTISGSVAGTGGCGNNSGTFSAVRGHIVPQGNISGIWSLFEKPTGSDVEQGPVFLSFVQTGNNIDIFVVPTIGTTPVGSGNIDGNSVQLIFPGQDNCGASANVTLAGILSADGNTLSGNYAVGTGNCGQTGTWTATKAQPPASDISGGWSATKTLNGIAQPPSCLTFAQTGNLLIVTGLEATGFGIISGSNVQLLGIDSSNPSNIKLTSVAGTLAGDGNSINGTYITVYSLGVPPTESGAWSAVKGACTQPTGTVSGTVKDTLGAPLAGVNVGVFQQDLAVNAGTTDSNGQYSLTAPAGSGYSVVFSKSGYTTVTKSNIVVSANATTTVDEVLTTILQAGQTRIVLTWGATPEDLDSHLTGPIPDSSSRFHVFYADECYPQGSCTFDNSGNRIPGANTYELLDHDDTSSFGPETTTIVQQFGGVYRFSVHDFTNSDSTSSLALSNSGAQVQIFQGDSLVQTFSIPTNQVGTLWTVFELDGNQITFVNSLSNQSNEFNIQSASRSGSSLKGKGKKR